MFLHKREVGKLLAKLRKQTGLSQYECAQTLGVTDKAISKWETGSAYPNIETLERLCALYKISLGAFFTLLEHPQKAFFTLAVTGGPCAGKSIAVELLKEFFERRGYSVFLLREVATTLINAGYLVPASFDAFAFQTEIFSVQIALENTLFTRANDCASERLAAMNAKSVSDTKASAKTLVLCDRGLADGKAYLSPADYGRLLQTNGLSSDDAFSRYDGVLVLESAAVKALGYTVENNPARMENEQQARALDARIKTAWEDHPHVSFVGASQSFEQKLLNTVRAACALLGEPEPTSLIPRRRFLVKKPALSALLAKLGAVEDDELVTFLEPKHGQRLALISRTRNGRTRYAQAPIRSDAPYTLDLETPLAPDAYQALLSFSDPAYKPVERKSVRLLTDGRDISLHLYDCYPFVAVAEIDLPLAEEQVDSDETYMPPYLQVVREITDSDAFSLRSIARGLAQGRL